MTQRRTDPPQTPDRIKDKDTPPARAPHPGAEPGHRDKTRPGQADLTGPTGQGQKGQTTAQTGQGQSGQGAKDERNRGGSNHRG